MDDIHHTLLYESDWYWGDLSKEDTAEKLKDKKDGYFLVRNSRKLGEFTLTVRKHGINRLVRIIFHEGLYGLNEPLKFSSVIELVEYYRRHSLAEFNSKLDVKLKFPVSRLTPQINAQIIFARLNEIQHEIRNKNSLFKAVEKEFTNTRISYDELCLLNSSQVLLVDLLNEHKNCMKTFIKTGVYPDILTQNKIQFDALLATEIGYLSEIEAKLDLLKRRDSEYEIKISLLRSELNCFINQREEYITWLLENGVEKDEMLSKLSEHELDEEIYGGTFEALNLLKPLSIGTETLTEFSAHSKLSSHLWLATSELDKNSIQQIFDDRGQTDGSFIVRPANDTMSSHMYTLEVMFKLRRYRIKIYNIQELFQLEKGPTFPTLEMLIQYYSASSLKSYKHILDTTLKFPIL